MKESYQSVLEELMASYKKSNIRFASNSDDSTFLDVITDPDFKDYVLLCAESAADDKRKDLIDVLTSVCILYESNSEAEEKLRKQAESYSSWSYGLCLLCGIGGSIDDNSAYDVLSGLEGPVGKYYALLRDNSFSMDPEIVSSIFKLLKVADSNEFIDINECLRHSLTR